MEALLPAARVLRNVREAVSGSLLAWTDIGYGYQGGVMVTPK